MAGHTRNPQAENNSSVAGFLNERASSFLEPPDHGNHLWLLCRPEALARAEFDEARRPGAALGRGTDADMLRFRSALGEVLAV